MDDLSPEVQKALAECRKELAASISENQRLKEEIAYLKRHISVANDAGISIIAETDDFNKWHRECLRMQSSLSWKITKPLRLIRKVICSFRTIGVRQTLSKIINYRK